MAGAEPDELKEAQALLKDARERLTYAAALALSYNRDEPAPYQPAAGELHRLLGEASDDYARIASLSGQLDRQASDRPQGRAVFGRLYHGWKAGREVHSFSKLVQFLRARLDRIAPLLDELDRKPLLVAERCRELEPVLDRINVLAQDLGAVGLCGTTFELAVAQGNQLGDRLEGLPPCFSLSAEDSILAQATKEDTIGAWQTLGEIQDPLRRCAAQFERWQQELKAVLVLQNRLKRDVMPALLVPAQALHQETAQWAPENWPPDLDVAGIWRDAIQTRSLASAGQPVELGRPLSVEELEGRLGQVQGLVDGIPRLQARLQGMGQILGKLKETEQAAMQRLESAYAALDRLVVALDTMQPSLGPKVTKHQGKLPGLRREGSELRESLRQRQVGSLESKAKLLDEWLGSCQRALQAFLEGLTQDVGRMKADLRLAVDEVQGVAPLDLEDAMRRAVEALKEPSPGTSLGSAVEGAPQDVISLAESANRLLKEREQILTAIQNLGSRVVGPLQGPRETWERVRRETQARYEQLDKLKRSVEGAWPPLGCDMQRVDDLLRRARGSEDRLPRQGRSVAQVLEILDGAVRTYEEASEGIKAQEGQIKQEHADLVEQMRRIERWQKQLRAYRQAHADDLAVSQAVDSRLAGIDEDLRALQTQWTRNPPSFGDANARLQIIWSGATSDMPLRGSTRIIRTKDIDGKAR